MSQGREFLNLVSIPSLARSTPLESLVYVVGKHEGYDYAKMFQKGLTLDIDPDTHPDIVDDVCHSRLLPDTADLFLFVGVYEFLSDPQQAIREIRRILKVNGLLLAALPGKGYWPAPGETGARVSLDVLPQFLEGFIIRSMNCFYAPNNELESCVVLAQKI